ncbi:MAG: hypothetical protein A3B11_01515 [Candidatus Taylorbacteria bacterium RIFCSPLOWO2_01_FULL_44_26]|uniref:Excinuclease ABC subunit C n=2 Tax=Candidatus Tayloriibacteriota TaxID=1817919 RepID=A0A1G2MLX5_9BACT|nr:MAG: hypothetical protein A3D50_01505 [Candidatus Taylorbacteria bacterium RIFCSPHIGHO2_02_FULL_44_12]OHA31278.1 MAG: hypothetical protein A3B11_01515 [Candidatus Taylorbacteria bacterium RIFCSPLOWO2_01_FULL_44_26]
MTSKQITKLNLPDAPGIYIFRDKSKRPLYIGRATSLSDRIKSYFGFDLLNARGPRIVDMITKSRSIDFQKTESVLEAIILESQMIKRYQPFYNIDDRDDKSSQYVVITDEEWPRVFLVRARDFDQALKEGSLEYKPRKYFGPYTEGKLIIGALKILRKLFPFKDKKSRDPRHDAFYRSMGMSPDIGNREERQEYNQNINYLILFFEGKKKSLRLKIKKEMNSLAGQLKFELAERSKRLLYALDHINDIALIQRQNSGLNRQFRIEAYDIAHLSGKDVVGAMVVSVGGEFAKNQYRRFKIWRQANDDQAALAEILYRRLDHSEWAYPDIIVVDGNHIQLHSAENVLKSRRVSIPVIAVTKNVKHKPEKLLGHPELIRSHGKDIIALNAEAHRFAIAYHRARSNKSFIDVSFGV